MVGAKSHLPSDGSSSFSWHLLSVETRAGPVQRWLLPSPVYCPKEIVIPGVNGLFDSDSELNHSVST